MNRSVLASKQNFVIDQGATKQVSDTVVAVFQIYDRHIANFLRIIKRINFGSHMRCECGHKRVFLIQVVG